MEELKACETGLYSPLVSLYTCVLCCFALFVCLTLLASFFLPSHLSFKNMCIIIHNLYVCTFTLTVSI